MTEQLNLLGTGQIIPTALHTEMERSYLEYAMSVIIGRALPDARDGLKPVHRRILYAMYELGLTPDRPYRKCARVVGDVLGKYHPHGDQSVYDALVRLVQSFSSRYPLLDGHGNFGSVDNDPPAAMRYTETRLSPISHQAMLDAIGDEIVGFVDNFDSSEQEPVVLPAQLPILLLNGCSGIAVGMATNVPPHNLGEIVDGLVALIDNPNLADEKLWDLIPGPDFPTGGEIVETKGITEAYSTGRGIIKVRGVAKVETIHLRNKKRRKERTAIIVNELPYQVNKAAWIEKVADQVNQSKLVGIADIRDESDRTGMRVVMELKKDASAPEVLKKLAKQTAFQSNFGAIMLALVNNKPVQLSLRQLLEEFLVFREETLRRQHGNELEKTQDRLHIVSGLLIALENIDTIVDILRNSADGTTAKVGLMEQLSISEIQADSILGMPMRRITGLEKQKLETEQAELNQKITHLETLLGDRHELMKSLKKEFRSLKRSYSDERRTKICQTFESTSSTTPKRARSSKAQLDSTQKTPISGSLFKPEPSEQAELIVTNENHIYWQNPDQVDQISSNNLKAGEEFIADKQLLGTSNKMVFAADSGRIYPVELKDIPNNLESQNATTLSFLSSAAQREASQTVAHFLVPSSPDQKPPAQDQSTQSATESQPETPNQESSDQDSSTQIDATQSGEPNQVQIHNYDLVLLSEQGMIKRLKGSELNALGNRGLVLMKLKDKDRLRDLKIVQADQELIIATNGGRMLRFPINDQQIPIMGRNAKGNQALRLRFGEKIIGCVTLAEQSNLLLVTELGYGKKLEIDNVRLSKRGDIGTQAINFNNKQDRLAAIMLVTSAQEAIATTSNDRRIPIIVDSVGVMPRDSKGSKVAKLDSGETISAIYPQ